MRVVKDERSLTVYRVTTGKRRVSVHAEFVPHRGPMGGWTVGIWKDRINYLHVQGGLSLGPIHLYAQWRHHKPPASSLSSAPRCGTCGDTGLVDWAPFQQRDSEDDQQPCPDCSRSTSEDPKD